MPPKSSPTYGKPLPPVSPDWSPVHYYDGYRNVVAAAATPHPAHACASHAHHSQSRFSLWPGGAGCDCFAF